MPGERVLIIGGTRDGRLLAAAVMAAGFEPVTSLAGVTRAPLLPAGAVRLGGFGGGLGVFPGVDLAKRCVVLVAPPTFSLPHFRKGHASSGPYGVDRFPFPPSA